MLAPDLDPSINVGLCIAEHISLVVFPHWRWLSSCTTKGFFLSHSGSNWLATKTLLLSHRGDIFLVCVDVEEVEGILTWVSIPSNTSISLPFCHNKTRSIAAEKNERAKPAFAYWYEFACFLLWASFVSFPPFDPTFFYVNKRRNASITVDGASPRRKEEARRERVLKYPMHIKAKRNWIKAKGREKIFNRRKGKEKSLCGKMCLLFVSTEQ